MGSLLEVRELCVSYRTRGGGVYPALRGLDFGVGRREILGVLGESGSGKSTLGASLLKLLPASAEITGGSVALEGVDVLRLEASELREIRGRRISLIHQEPSTALHPTMRVGEQLGEVLRAHGAMSAKARRERVKEILASVFAADVERVFSSYPHQLSGGQRQRVVIAQAIACGPSLLVADEPTAALDPSTQDEILMLLQKLRKDLGLAILLITHNPALLAGIADRVLVLYAGKIAELGPIQEVLFSPRHPYTKALLECVPRATEEVVAGRKLRRPVIPGESPNLRVLPAGCAFEPRCGERMKDCTSHEPVPVTVDETEQVACLRFGN
jgi:oligopeptide/dipeptide ABC transporter ATP-binding protein